MRNRLPHVTDRGAAPNVSSGVVQVASEAIDEIEYDPDGSTLFVRFAHGGWYRYFAVPAQVYEAFIAAKSHGRYFHEHIRYRFPFRRGR